eukprot:655826-Amphidinium_carterae.1
MEAAQEYTSSFDETDPLYTTMYPWLAWLTSSGELVPGWETEASMRNHWIEYETFSMFGSRGEKAKRSRWFQASRRWREMRASSGHILLSIMYLGLSSDWWGDLSSSPWRLREQTLEEVVRRKGQMQRRVGV